MKPFVLKSATKPGIWISTESRPNSCDVEIVIPNQYCTSKRNLKVSEYPMFKLEIKFTCKGGTYPKGLHLSFKKMPYPTDSTGKIILDRNAFISIELLGVDYSGILTIYRSCYMDPNLFGKLRKERKLHHK